MPRNELFIGAFRLDPAARALTRNGQPVRLGSRALDVLCVLAAANGAVVKKDELIARVWPDAVVEENNLQVHVSAIRKLLAQDRDGENCLVTVPGRGYRLIVHDSLHTGPQDTAAEDPLFLPNLPSIVVLPFTNLSDDPAQEYFADGMVEEITIALGRVPRLFVISSSSAFVYKARLADPKQVAAELGVRYVLKGSVRRNGDNIRINTELSDTLKGTQIWADRFEGSISGLFELQDGVAASVSARIAPKLRAAEATFVRRKPTQNMTAYDLYLRALPPQRDTLVQNEQSLQLLYRAIDLDPSFSGAYGLAAYCYHVQTVFGWLLPSDPRMQEGLRLAQLAAETGDNDPEALWMAGRTISVLGGDAEQGRALIDRSLCLNPNSAQAWWASGMARAFMGAADVAIEHLNRGRRLILSIPPVTPTGLEWRWLIFFPASMRTAEPQSTAPWLNGQAPPACGTRLRSAGCLGNMTRRFDACSNCWPPIRAQASKRRVPSWGCSLGTGRMSLVRTSKVYDVLVCRNEASVAKNKRLV